MEIIASKTVAQVVAENYKTADVFKKYGIDFCCGGGISLLEMCRKKGLDYAVIEKDLKAIDDQVSQSYDFNNWSLDFLIDFIVNTHHQYVVENIPLLIQYSEKVARVHGHYYTETVEIRNLLQTVTDELRIHMLKEEEILFPFIKGMVNAREKGFPMPDPPFGAVQNPIRMMEEEHESAGNIFKEIAALSKDYSPPEGACNTFRVLYAKLKEFEEDLHQHIHLENNILFPKAILMERFEQI